MQKREVSKQFLNISKQKINALLEWLRENQIDPEAIDFDSVGKDIDYQGLKSFLTEEYGLIVTDKDDILKHRHEYEDRPKQRMHIALKEFSNPKIETEAQNFLVLGKKGSGKSNTGWAILQTQHLKADRPAYVYRCPQPELLKKIPFKVTNLSNLSQMFHLRDSACLVDEANIYFDVRNKQVNDDLKRLLQHSRQNNTTFIFIVHDSYVFNRGLFPYLDVKIIKELNEGHWDLERRHMRAMYKNVRVAGKENMYIDSEDMSEYVQTPLLKWWTEEFSNMYRMRMRVRQLFATDYRSVRRE